MLFRNSVIVTHILRKIQGSCETTRNFWVIMRTFAFIRKRLAFIMLSLLKKNEITIKSHYLHSLTLIIFKKTNKQTNTFLPNVTWCPGLELEVVWISVVLYIFKSLDVSTNINDTLFNMSWFWIKWY